VNKKEIRVGIVGCGFITREVHIPALLRCKDARIAAVCDINLGLAQQIAKQHNIAGVYSDFTEMLSKEKLDVVHICTSTETVSHAALSIQAMEAGCHVFTEKPMAANTDEADRVVATAKKLSRKFSIAHNYLYLPAFVMAKKYISRGALGEITRVNILNSSPPWDFPAVANPEHWRHKLTGGVFANTLPHSLYIAREILGDIEIATVKSNKFSKYEHLTIDDLKVDLKGRNSAGSIMASCNWPSLWQLDIYGTEMNLHCDLNYQYVVARKGKSSSGRASAKVYAMENLSRSFQILKGSLETGIKVLKGQHRGHFLQVKEFIGNVKNDTQPLVTGEDGRENVRLLKDVLDKLSG
jgi:UDP-N-acetylglucosamine 3-dehydrogenase